MINAQSLVVCAQTSRLGVHLAPGVSSLHDSQFSMSAELEPRFNFNCGIQYMVKLKQDFFYFETGFYFKDRGTKQLNFVTHYNNGPDKTSDIKSHTYHLSIPLKVRFEYAFMYAALGPTLEYYLTTKYVYSPEEDKTIFIDWSNGFINDISFGIDFDIGVQFDISDHFTFFSEYSFNPSAFYKNGGFWSYHSLHEIGLGVYYNFKSTNDAQ